MANDATRTPLLVLGLGNILCEDDGAGVEVVRRIAAAFEAPEGVRFVDGGTLGLALLPLVEDADTLLLVDAVDSGAAPGTLVFLEGGEVPRAAMERLSPHQVGVGDLLHGALWLDHLPSRLLLAGVVPERVGLGLERSDAVEAALPALTGRVIDMVRGLGFELRPRAGA